VEAAGIEPASGRFDRRCLQAYPVLPLSPTGPPTGKVSGRPAPSVLGGLPGRRAAARRLCHTRSGPVGDGSGRAGPLIGGPSPHAGL